MMFFTLTLFGCIVAAVPLIIHATRGSSTSTATVLINRDAATVYAEAVKTVKQRGYTQITKQDDAKYFLEGTRKGKNATLQVIPVGSDQSRIIITIENDKDATGINEAVEATPANLPSIGSSVRRTKELSVDRRMYANGVTHTGRYIFDENERFLIVLSSLLVEGKGLELSRSL